MSRFLDQFKVFTPDYYSIEYTVSTNGTNGKLGSFSSVPKHFLNSFLENETCKIWNGNGKGELPSHCL